MRTDSPAKVWAVTFAVAIFPLLGFWLYGLFDLDEGFYAAVSWEMMQRGEWITPYYNGNPWFEKPILLYWFAIPSISAFGEEVGPRLPAVLATVSLYGVCGIFLARCVSLTAGRLCVLILGSCLLLVGVGRMMLTDPLLNLCLAGAFVAFFQSLTGDRRWRLVSAGLLGFSVLAKGPIGLPVFLALAIWTYIAEPELRPQFRGHWLLGTVLLFGAVATWYLPAYLVNRDEFVQRFLIEQNLQRFTGGDTAHAVVVKGGGIPDWLSKVLSFVANVIYYPLILFVGTLPWSIFAAKFWPRKGSSHDGQLQRYLVRWCLVVLVFFTISGSKLPHYILPAIAPVAMLAALGLAARNPNPRLIPVKALVATLAVATLLNFGLMFYYSLGHQEVHALAKQISGDRLPVAAYQMPRREKDMGTGKPKIQETSHPSLVLYLRRTFIETEDLAPLAEQVRKAGGMYVITRSGRVGAQQISEAEVAGMTLSEVPRSGKRDNYDLFLLRPKAPND